MSVPDAADAARRATGRQSAARFVLPGLVTAAYAATMFGIASPLVAIFCTATQLALVWPGILIVRAVAGPAAGWLAPLAFGAPLGLALSSLALLPLWAAGARGLWALAAAPLLAALLAWPAARLRGRFQWMATTAADRRWLLILLLMVPLVVARPFANVGADLPDGRAYRAYFTADYVWRRAVVAEVAKGDFLPVNPFYTGDALHYYWLWHLPDALQYRAFGDALGMDPLLMTHAVVIDAVFVAFLYGLTRLFVATPWAAAGAVTCGVLFTSLEGSYAIWRLGFSLERMRSLNIDALSRWWLGGMPIDGLQRVLLYQPQHAIGYAMGFLGLLAVVRRTRREDPAAFAIGGSLLALCVLISSFSGLMFTAVAAVYEAVSVLRWREWRRALVHAVMAALPLAIASLLASVLQYVDRSGTVATVGVNATATHRFIATTLLSGGPAIVLCAAGALVALRRRRADLVMFVAFLAVNIGFYFLVDIPDHQHVYVGWRVGALLFMASPIFIGLAFEAAAGLRGALRALAAAGVAIVVLLAAPMSAIDLYNTQDIANRSQGPGFRWTTVLSHDELDAFRWIKTATPPSAVFQVDPIARGAATWFYLPAFAERRMAVGLPTSMIPLAKYQRGATVVRDMLSMPNPADTHDIATRFGIRYLLCGPPERAANPGLQQRLETRPDLFPLLFRNGTISIYGVTR